MADGSGDRADPYVELAKASLKSYVETGEMIALSPDGGVSAGVRRLPFPDCGVKALLNERAGAFVSIKKNGELRGCIGTISAVRDNLAQEIIENAISACSRDPRFEPVAVDELPELTLSVDVLSDAEPVESKTQLDVSRYGVIVSRGYRRGLLLPNLEGVDSVEYQLRIALSKAGIRPDEKYSIERFEVVRHESGGSMR